MTRTPRDALAVLRKKAADGSLGTLCERLGIELLVAHGSAVVDDALRKPRDLDLAFGSSDRRADIVEIVAALIDASAFEGIDVMDLRRAGDVTRARALGPHSELMYEARPSLFTEAQIAALTTEMESRYLRRRDLELMAQR